MTEDRRIYMHKCSEREMVVRKKIWECKRAIKIYKIWLNMSDDEPVMAPREQCLAGIRWQKLKLNAMKKLLPDCKVYRSSEGDLITDGVLWADYFKKYFRKCINEDEVLEMNVEICNAVKRAAKNRMDAISFRKALRVG